MVRWHIYHLYTTYSPCRTWGVKNATDPTFYREPCQQQPLTKQIHRLCSLRDEHPGVQFTFVIGSVPWVKGESVRPFCLDGIFFRGNLYTLRANSPAGCTWKSYHPKKQGRIRMGLVLYIYIPSLKLTASSPLEIGAPWTRRFRTWKPAFSVANLLLVSGRVGVFFLSPPKALALVFLQEISWLY